MSENPANLEIAEIRAERQAGAGAETVHAAGAGVLRYVVCHARVLPDDGVHHWLASFPVPEDCGFTLIGDAYRSQVGTAKASLLEGPIYCRLRGTPDFLRIMLHPSRLRIDLSVLLLRA